MLKLQLESFPYAFALPLAHVMPRKITRGTDAAEYILSDAVSPGSDMWVKDTAHTKVVRP